LEYVLNEGKNLLDSGSRFINGKRNTYRERPLESFKTYQDVEDEYFETFKEFIRRDTIGGLVGHGAVTAWCPATLLNAFVADLRERGSDFYENGAEYKLIAPQYTGLANLINSLWNIKTLVYETGETTLD
jgi:pyruvate-formate lyase